MQLAAFVPVVPLLITWVAGCGVEESRTEVFNAPPPRSAEYISQRFPDFHIAFRWNADPGVDLSSPALRYVRALVESGQIYSRTKDLSATYPGFDVRFLGSYADVLVDFGPFPRWRSTYWSRIESVTANGPTFTVEYYSTYDRDYTFDGATRVKFDPMVSFQRVTVDLSGYENPSSRPMTPVVDRPSSDQFAHVRLFENDTTADRTLPFACGKALANDMATQPPVTSPGWPVDAGAT